MRWISPTPCVSFLLIVAAGCESTRPTSLERSIREYQDNQWLLSEMWAEKSLDEHLQIDEAQYMMGLCEFQLERFHSANQWFLQAATSSNPDVRGKSNAMVGLIASSRGEFDVANSAFKTASVDLEGRDKMEAKSRMSSTTSDNSPVHTSPFYTLQFGAYLDRANANSKITSLNPSLVKAGLGEAWIVEEKERIGRTMFLVHAGRFPSRMSAFTRRKRGDLPQCFVQASP